jgi:Transcriptional regulator
MVMPKQTFLNLPKEKQQTLINAALKEFSRVPLNEALISNIIAEADIPRGSFYQYFENKEDLFYYVFSTYAKKGERAFINTLKKNNGDLLDTFVDLYGRMLELIENDEKKGYFKNLFMNMNHKVDNAFSPSMKKHNHSKIIKDFYDLIDRDKLNISDMSDIRHIVIIIKSVTIHNMMMVFANNVNKEDALEKYKTEINLLKNGLYKG